MGDGVQHGLPNDVVAVAVVAAIIVVAIIVVDAVITSAIRTAYRTSGTDGTIYSTTAFAHIIDRGGR